MKKLLLTLLLIVPLVGFSQSQNENYVISRTYKDTLRTQQVGHDKNKVMTNIQYFDGLGRLKQSIGLEAGGKTNDIVTHVSYDNLGRQTKEYLPFSNGANNANIRTGDVGLATQTYHGQKYAEDFAGVSLPSDINAYSEKSFDNSPLNRVMKQGAPGKDWKLGNNHEIRFDYQTNLKTEVRKFYVTTSFANNTYTPTLQLNAASTNNNGFYEEGELFKSITKDENWTSGLDHTTEEFKNKQGQVILKRTYNNNERHDTYYIYDDFGNLTYVLPPKMNGTSSSLSTVRSMLNNLGYQYKYDHLNRLVEKKIPGKGWEYIVYDKLDRPVMTQDTNLKAKNRWLFTKYDHLGRVIYTGYKITSSSRISLQNAANNPETYKQWELRTTTTNNVGGTIIYYTSKAIPGASNELYTVNYYDTYINLPSGLGTTITTSYGEKSTANTKGLPTVSKVKVLETSNWITTVTYYDDKARPIYVYSKNDYLNTIDIVESKLDYLTGKVLETKTTHIKTGKDPIVTIDRFEYDHMDRLVSQTQKINNLRSRRIVKNNYDVLGQLESKLLGNGTRVGYKDVTSGLSIRDNIITKTGTTGWSHGLATKGSINGDGYVEFKAGTVNKYFIAGLSDKNLDAAAGSIDYGIYLYSDLSLRIKEGIDHSFATSEKYKKGDIFRIERIGNRIHYKKNGVTFYISEKISSGSLLGDVSLYHTGAKIKDFKIVDNSTGLQKVDYKYNVRGWLTNINEDVHNDNDLFNFEIRYNNPTNGTALYNGNISQTSWQTLNEDATKKTYRYSYDALNRLTDATGVTTSNYDVSGITYDKNGNITFLERRGHINSAATNFGIMDHLTYIYDSGNKLKKMEDRGDKTFGFKDGANISTEYTYDANGNMITDKNKGITSITYNHLNLPTTVGFSSKQAAISYTYSADGTKLSKVVAGSGLATTTTQYAGNHIYENGELQFFSHAEGYVSAELVSGTLKFENVYQYKDHLGNIRLSYTDNNGDGNITQNEIVEEKNYYPFGLQHKGYNDDYSSSGNSIANKFGYNSVELEEALGLNLMEMDVRNYDPAIARWTGIDPVIHHDFSPYQAFDNDPVFWADPSGADSEVSEGGYKLTFTGKDAVDAFNIIKNSLPEKNNEDDDSDDPELRNVYREVAAFGDRVDYRYQLIDDKKNIHKITITGTTSLRGRQQRRQELEIIIEVNEGRPRVVSTKLTGAIYNLEQRCTLCGGHYKLVNMFKPRHNFQSSLVDYLTSPLLDELYLNPEYNPFNGSVNSNKTTDIITGLLGASKKATGKDIITHVLGKQFSRIYYAVAGGVALGNLYRNNVDHTGRTVKLRLYDSSTVKQRK